MNIIKIWQFIKDGTVGVAIAVVFLLWASTNPQLLSNYSFYSDELVFMVSVVLATFAGSGASGWYLESDNSSREELFKSLMCISLISLIILFIYYFVIFISGLSYFIVVVILWFVYGLPSMILTSGLGYLILVNLNPNKRFSRIFVGAMISFIVSFSTVTGISRIMSI